MRFIIFILLLSNLAACSYLKPRHQEYLINKRTPVANSNLITEQELSIQNQQVNSVLNEYRFNENFDDTPIENISLNQALYQSLDQYQNQLFPQYTTLVLCLFHPHQLQQYHRY